MPQHPEREPLLGILEPLDRAVVGPRDFAQPATDPAETLMVRRFHGCAVAEHRTEPGLVLDLHAVVGEDTLHLAVLFVADDVWQMLDEIAPARSMART